MSGALDFDSYDLLGLGSTFRPYASAAPALLEAGWYPLPLPPGSKSPPPTGYTGWNARPVTQVEIDRWVVDHGGGNVAVRLPDGVIGIDVDDYGDKHGAAELVDLEALYGPLPPTVRSTARGGESGIRLYQVQVGTRLRDASPSIEVIQSHHRFVVVAPSLHPGTGTRYEWFDDGGDVLDGPPEISELAHLPWAWVAGLTVSGPAGAHGLPVTTEQVVEFVGAHTDALDPRKLNGIDTSLRGRRKGRHATLVDLACQIARESAAGLYAATDGFDRLLQWWLDVMDDQRRIDGTEFADAISWAIGQADADPERVAEMRARAERRPPMTMVTGSPAIVDPPDAENVANATTDLSHLPESFWSARPVLTQIRQAAHCRMVSPDAVLGVVLARVAAFTPPMYPLPTMVGTSAPITTYIALVGDSSSGKSGAKSLGCELLPCVDEHVADDFQLGSGEGMVELFFDSITEGKGADRRTTKVQKRNGGFFTLDEGQALADLGKRAGSTLLSTLRSAWSGQTIGSAGASADTKRRLPAGGYSIGLVIGFQAEHAAELLADDIGGTPQRFVWLAANDPAIPLDPPDWPGVIEWTPLPTRAHGGMPFRNTMTADPSIVAEVRGQRLRVSRGELKLAKLDGHRMLVRLKVAGCLAVLDGRTDIDVDDWSLAEVVMTTSDAVRSRVVLTIEIARRQTEERRTARTVATDGAVNDGQISRAVGRMALAMAKHVHRGTCLEGCNRGCVTRSTAGRDRTAATVDDVIDHAVSKAWIRVDGDVFTAGTSRPT